MPPESTAKRSKDTPNMATNLADQFATTPAVTAEIRGATFVAHFNAGVNNLVSLRNLLSGEECIPHAPHAPIITLFGWADGVKLELVPGAPRFTPQANELIITWDNFGARAVTVQLTLRAAEDQLHISASIENNDPVLEITEILLPHISGVQLGSDFRDDSIIYPHHAGERTLNPVMGYGAHKKDFWRASSVAFGDHYRREINYCGLASMSWMYLYDARNGLYIGSHDARFPVTGIIAETSGSEENPWMAFAFRKYHRIRSGERYESSDYVLALSTRDWHYGAQLYRAYIAPYLDFDHTPAFLKSEVSLNQCYNFKRRGTIENYFRDIPRMYDAGAEWGVRHMFIASWNRTGFDSYYPEYYPDMELGSAMEFRRGLEYIRSQGGFSTLYINTRIFDVKSDFHPTLGERMAIRTETGDVIRETYGPEHFTVNCPADKLWREHLLDTAEFTVKAYGADGIYLDQLASAEPLPCYSAEHSHEDIGEMNAGYLYVLKNLSERLKAHNPNAYIMVENCGDIYGAYTWGNLTWNGAEYDEHYNVFKYTFPEFVQVNMVNPRGWEKDPDAQRVWFYKDMQRATLLGSIFWLGITTHLTEDAGEYYEYARAALAFRTNVQPLIEDAAFLDDAHITATGEGCDATTWQLPDGSWLVLAGNHALTPEGAVTIALPAPAASVTVHDLDWNATTVAATGASVTIPLNATRLACIRISAPA